MGCACHGQQPQAEAHLVMFPDGTSELFNDEPAARAAIVSAGGGTRTVLQGASAEEMRRKMASTGS